VEPEVVMVLGVAGIFGLVILGLAVLLVGGKLRVSREEVEVSSEQMPVE